VEVRLDGKVALVTGGSRGIGKAMAASFSAAGARVMISSRKAASLREAAASISGEVAWFPANAGDDAGATACVEATMERFGRLDILVNNAATNPYRGPIIGLDRPRALKTSVRSPGSAGTARRRQRSCTSPGRWPPSWRPRSG